MAVVILYGQVPYYQSRDSMAKHQGKRVGHIACRMDVDACRDAIEARIGNRPWFLTRQPLLGRLGENGFAVKLERVTRERG